MAISRFDKAQMVKPVSQYVPLNLPWEQVARTVQMKDAQQQAAMKKARGDMGTALEKLEDYQGADNVSVVDDSGDVRNIFVGGAQRVGAIKNKYYDKVNNIANNLATTDLTSGASDIVDDIYNLKREIRAQTSKGGELYVHDKLRSDIEKGWGVVQENWGEVKKDPSVAYDYNRWASNIAGQYASLGDEYSQLTAANMQEIYQNPKSYLKVFGTPTGSQPGASDATDVRKKLYGYLDKIETQGALIPPTATSNGMWKYGDETYRSEELVEKLAKDVLRSNPEIGEAFQNRAQMKGMFRGALPEGVSPEDWLKGELTDMVESAGETFKKYDPSVSYKAMPSGWGYTQRDLADVGEWSSGEVVVGESFDEAYPGRPGLSKYFPEGVSAFFTGESTRDVAIAAPTTVESDYVPMDRLYATTDHTLNFEGEDLEGFGEGIRIKRGEQGREGFALTNARGVFGFVPVNNSGKILTVNDKEVRPGEAIPEKDVEAFAIKYSGRGDVIAFSPYVKYSGTPMVSVNGVEKEANNRVEMYSIPETEAEFGAVVSGKNAMEQANKSRAKLAIQFNLKPNETTILFPGDNTSRGVEQPQEEQTGDENVTLDLESYE